MKSNWISVSDLSPKTKKVIMIAIFILVLMQNFNSNMFSIAGAATVAQLSGTEYYTLQFTLFTLISGILIPIFGTLGDVQGRKRWLAIGAVLFLISEVIMTIAPTMFIILVGRVVLAVSQGILSANQLTLIGEIADDKERPMFMTLNNIGIGVAVIAAPLLAGLFVDYSSWRWVFLFLSILSLVGVIFCIRFIPSIKTAAIEDNTKKSIDWGGGAMLAVFGLAFLLIFTWGPGKGWTSLTLIILYILVVISLILFFVFEKKVQNPMVPFFLFKYRGFTLGLIAMLAYGPACYAFSTYTSQIGLGVMGMKSTATGTLLTIHAIGFLISSFVSGKLISSKGAKALKGVQLFCLFGLGIVLIAFTFFSANTPIGVMYLLQFCGGICNAPLIVGFTQILQKEVPKEYIGIGTALLQFMMKLGGTFGLTIGGLLMSGRWSGSIYSILNSDVASTLGEDTSSALSSSGTLLDPNTVESLRSAFSGSAQELFENVLSSVRSLLSSSLGTIFWLCAVLVIVSAVIMCFVKSSKEKETASK